MSQAPDQISQALDRARRRWLLAATVNAGGRWAVLPGCAAALIGIALALAGGQSLWWFLPLSVLGLAGIAATLLVTRQLYSRPGAPGAPDWALLLDRGLGMDDALATWCEADGAFKTALAAGITGRLDPKRERAAAPEKHWAGLILALILALMPLVFLRLDSTEPPESQDESPVAQADPPPAAGDAPSSPGAGGGQGDGDGQGEDQGPGEGDQGGGEGSGEGETQRPPEAGTGGSAGEKPDDAEPDQPDDPSRPRNDGASDNDGPPPDPEPAQPPGKIDDEVKPVTPPAGKGETRTERRSRWVYNPDGEGIDESTPSPRLAPGIEGALPRTRATSSERKLVEDVYRKLNE